MEESKIDVRMDGRVVARALLGEGLAEDLARVLAPMVAQHVAAGLDYAKLAAALAPHLVAELRRLPAGPASAAPDQARLSRAELAQALKISTGTVDRLAKRGMPSVMVGDLPRFILADCEAWLRQEQERDRAKETAQPRAEKWEPGLPTQRRPKK